LIYVDENLCTGCEICLDACNRDAISISGRTATIDETLCTSCGQCIDLCPAGAIISVETISEAPSASVPAQSPQAQPLWAGTAPLFPAGSDAAALAAASPAPAGSAPSKLEVAEKVLSGLLSFASFVLDRRQGRLVERAASSTSGAMGVGRNAGGTSTGGSGRPGPRQVRGGGRGLGAGQGRGRAQGRGDGRGSGQGRGGRCKANK
jgi:NAD-dependent dihydropyrimidine dehydrogenase PreA subunit